MSELEDTRFLATKVQEWIDKLVADNAAKDATMADLREQLATSETARKANLNQYESEERENEHLREQLEKANQTIDGFMRGKAND